MKIIKIVILFLLSLTIQSCDALSRQENIQSNSGSTKIVMIEEAKAEIIIKKLQLVRSVPSEKPCKRIEDAANLLNTHISMSCYPSAASEYKNWFIFSGGDSATPDNGSFKSGFAIEKNTCNIYSWKY